MKTIRAAIIGQGRSGRDIHGKHMLIDGRYEIAAVVDELDFRRERAAREYGCDVCENYKQLYGRNDIDVVVNASYSHQHAPITLDLLRHGFNVLSDKPFAGSVEQVDDIVLTAKQHGRKVAAFQQSRFAPYYEKVLSVIASGVLGRIVQVNVAFSGFQRRWDWQTLQENTAGSLFNTGPHPLDQALNLLGNDDLMPDVLCRMDRANTFGDAEDYVKLILTARNHPLIDIEVSSCDAYPSYTYKIQGTRGGLKGSMTQIDWRYFSEGEAPERHLVRESLRDAEGLPMYCSEKLTWVEESWRSEDARVFTYAVRRYYDHLYDFLVSDIAMPVTIPQVRRQIAVIEECHRQNPLPRLS